MPQTFEDTKAAANLLDIEDEKILDNIESFLAQSMLKLDHEGKFSEAVDTSVPGSPATKFPVPPELIRALSFHADRILAHADAGIDNAQERVRDMEARVRGLEARVEGLSLTGQGEDRTELQKILLQEQQSIRMEMAELKTLGLSSSPAATLPSV